jgi:FkbM family methyltransferase
MGLKKKLNFFLKEIISKRNNVVYNIILKIVLFFRGKYFGLNNIDEKIENYLDCNSGFYVEIGANNGFDQSNTLYFEICKNWKGILVEPLRDKFLEIKKYRDKKNNKIFNRACVGFDSKKKYVEITNLNLMSFINETSKNINSKKHINNFKKLNYKFHNITKKKVRSCTLNKIFKISRAPSLMDVFFLDVEGSELEVLKGIDFRIYNFKYLVIESRNINEIRNFLKKKNYKMIKKITYHDYLFKFVN